MCPVQTVTHVSGRSSFQINGLQPSFLSRHPELGNKPGGVTVMAGRTQMVFRYTQISQYLRCLRSNRYRYLDGVHSVHCLIDWQDKHESLRLKPVRTGNVETLYYYAFPREQWRCLRTNNPLECLLRAV